MVLLLLGFGLTSTPLAQPMAWAPENRLQGCVYFAGTVKATIPAGQVVQRQICSGETAIFCCVNEFINLNPNFVTPELVFRKGEEPGARHIFRKNLTPAGKRSKGSQGPRSKVQGSRCKIQVVGSCDDQNNQPDVAQENLDPVNQLDRRRHHDHSGGADHPGEFSGG